MPRSYRTGVQSVPLLHHVPILVIDPRKKIRRCTALSTDLDGDIAGRRTHELTEELLSAFDPDILWDEYGIDADIIVRTSL